jgi:hypothetical protein
MVKDRDPLKISRLRELVLLVDKTTKDHIPYIIAIVQLCYYYSLGMGPFLPHP